MNAPRLHILIALLMTASLHVWGQESPSRAETPEVDTQLRINKTTLLENKSDQNRVDAATLLLFNESPAAREILLDVLSRSDNPGARAAVCAALNPSRVGQRPLRNKEDFIEPLVSIIASDEDFGIVRLATEATLLFGYSQVQQDLEEALSDPALSAAAKKNVVYALKRHPDKQAVVRLMSLVDGDDEVAEAAVRALGEIGIHVSRDEDRWRRMLTELQQRPAEAFMRERLVRQETRVRELETQLASWQKRYLSALGGLYDTLTEEGARNAFLAQHLGAQEMMVRSWALDKLEELRKGTNKLKLSERLESALLATISDTDRQVRSKTARLLSLMGEVNAAKPLLDQLKNEKDEQVQREMFMALGAACYFASLPTAGHKLPEEIRRETLEYAVDFLDAADAERARSGAEVIGKLLEQDGLEAEEVDKYLKALSQRYARATEEGDHGLRGYLLGAMAGLCTTRSTCRQEAADIYRPVFEQSLTDPADVVRQAGIDGLLNIDRPGALRRLGKEMADDPSVAIRARLIDVAAEAGGAPELEWLSEKFGPGAEGEAAWQAGLKIFRRSPPTVAAAWTGRIAALPDEKVTPEQKIAFFTLVEQKAQAEENAGLRKEARTNLVRLYTETNNSKQAAEYLRGLLAEATDEAERQEIASRLLRIHLDSSNFAQAGELIGKTLSEKNLQLTAEHFVVRAVEEHLNRPSDADPNSLLKVLEQVKIADQETGQSWRTLLGRWTERFAKARKPEEADRASN